MMKSLILLVCLAVAIHGQGQQQQGDDLFARLFREDNSNAYQGGQNEGNFERLNFEADGSVRFPTNFGQAQAEEQRFSPNIQYAVNDDNGGQRYSPRFSQQIQSQQQDTQNFAPSTNFDQLRPFQFSNY